MSGCLGLRKKKGRKPAKIMTGLDKEGEKEVGRSSAMRPEKGELG